MAETWTVTGQRQINTMVDGEFTSAMEVTAKTSRGETFQVVVPTAHYDADTVRDMIERRVATMDAIAEL